MSGRPSCIFMRTTDDLMIFIIGLFDSHERTMASNYKRKSKKKTANKLKQKMFVLLILTETKCKNQLVMQFIQCKKRRRHTIRKHANRNAKEISLIEMRRSMITERNANDLGNMSVSCAIDIATKNVWRRLIFRHARNSHFIRCEINFFLVYPFWWVEGVCFVFLRWSALSSSM